MPPISPQEIVSNINQIGSLPQTLSAVLKVINRPDANTGQIAEVISKDVSLTTRVLKMVNSTRYARHGKVGKVTEAVKIMGLNSVKMLTLSSSVFGMLPDSKQVTLIDFKRIWRHLIGVATSARTIAKESEYADPEEAFVAGILHDAGLILMILYFNDEYFEAVKKMTNEKCGMPFAEKEIFGFTHCDVGAELVKQWKLPTRFEFVMQNHHDIEAPCPIDGDAQLNDIVSLADRLTQGPFDEYYPEIEENIDFIQAICKKLGLDGETAHKIRKESLTQTIQLAEYLEIDVGNILDIISEANTQLAEMYFDLEKLYLDKAVARALSKRELVESE